MKELASLLCLLSACVAPPVGITTNTVVQDTPIRVSQNTQNEVDVLFMIDNSPSMDAMQLALVSKFQTFLDVFDAVANPTDGSTPQYADLHIGVVTSDYGAGDVPGNGCGASPGGDKGLLQAKGAAAAASCGAPMGASYIEYTFGKGTDTCNLAGGCTPKLLGEQFTCMASVGSKGCGFEHQLESVYAALQPGANPGFLRDEALLAVVFVTNEDDGSAPPSADFYNPSNDPTLLAKYGAYTTYRQTRFGVSCGDPTTPIPEGASNGPLTGCAPGGVEPGEYAPDRYQHFFTTPGVLKGDPVNDVILVAIDAPVMPVQTLLAQTLTGSGVAPNPAYVPCNTLGPDCVVALQHSCQNSVQPEFFGDPPLRIESVVNAQHLNQTSNICGDDPTQPPDYTQALQQVAKLISSAVPPGCVPAELPDPSNPDCKVEDVTTASDGSIMETTIMACSATNGVPPCWTASVDSRCAQSSPQSISVQIVRPAGYTVPPDTSARVECSTKACPAENPDC